MRHLSRRLALTAALTLFLLLTLSGCFFRGVEDLYAVPEAPKEFRNLQEKIRQLTEAGGEIISPLTGEKVQSVQLQDLDGDGIQEAIVFIRNSGAEKPLQIYIFRQQGDDYVQAALIEDTAPNINSIQYENLDDDPTLEIIVSWLMSEKVHPLAAYSVDLDQNQTVELMRTDYTEFKVCDLDRDNRKEILTLQIDEKNGHRADFYDFRDGALALQSSAPLSSTISSIVEVKTGKLRGGIPAVFVASNRPLMAGAADGRISDIFAWRDNALSNITLDLDGTESGETLRYYTVVGAADINGDTITELPRTEPVIEYKNAGSASNFWILYWRQFDLYGKSWPVFSTYYNYADGWYLVLPEAWEGKITLRRADKTGGGERGVVFSYWEGDDAVPPVDFMTIYRLSGSNRQKLAQLPGRFLLLPDAEEDAYILYAAEFTKSTWDCGLDEDGLLDLFRLIQTNWATGV